MNQPMGRRQAKAYAKALRPWYAKKRWWLFLLLVGGSAAIAVSVANSPELADKARGVVNKPENDVAIESCGVNESTGWASATVRITNHSSKRSNYIANVRIITPNGDLWDTALTGTAEVDAGQSTTQTAQSLKSGAPAGVTCERGSVTRYATR